MGKSLKIFGKSVKPGNHALVRIPIARLSTGTLIDMPVYVFNGREDGPNLLVQGGLHGDEVNGVEIIRKMLAMKSFNVLRGACIVVPILNIFGFIHYSRDVPDGKDINRSFPGYKSGSLASRVAWTFMKEILPYIDVGIDLHTGGGRRNNFPQVRYTSKMPETLELAEAFGAPYYFASNLIPKSVRAVAYKKKIPIIVYEGGETLTFDTTAVEEGILGIQRVIRHLGMRDKGVIPPPESSIHILKRKWLRAHNSGMLITDIQNGDHLKKGDKLGYVTDAYGSYKKSIKAPVDCHVICVNNQAVVSRGDAVYHIGISNPKLV